MTQGLQCWNERGEIVVDIGDYNVSLVSRMNVTMPARQTYTEVGFNGMDSNGWFVVIVGVWGSSGISSFDFMCTPFNGGFAVALANSIYQETYCTVEIYKYI